jgi:hypothetical protein
MSPDDAVTETTKHESAGEAGRSRESDRPPTAEEEEAAEESRQRYESDREQVAQREDEMLERGANAKGEGEIQ